MWLVVKYFLYLLVTTSCLSQPVLSVASLLIMIFDRLESVQRPGVGHLTYKERLSMLGLESLELRQLRTDILLTYKILFCIIDVDVSRSLFVLRPNNRPSHGHSFKLLQEHCITDICKRFFSLRVANVWNSLLASIIGF